MKRTLSLFMPLVLLLIFTAGAIAQDATPRACTITAATYTDKAQCDVYEANATSNAITLTLIAPAKRRAVVVIKTDSSANAVTVATAGTGATINGASTYVLNAQNSGAVFYANGKTGSSGVWRVAASASNGGSDLFFSSQARGDIIRRNASSWGRYSAKTSGQILIGDGTDVVSVAVSGDVTVNSSGVAAIGAAKVLSAMMDETLIRYATVSIASADITGTSSGQLGHANGYPLVSAPGSGKAIELISAVVINDFATAAYTGGGNITVNYSGGGAALSGAVSFANSIGAAADKIAIVLPTAPTNNQLADNTGLSLVAASAPTQPGTAAGVVRVKVAYRVHTTGL